ncbi:MAG: DsbA family protein [Actinomycetota bacterium]
MQVTVWTDYICPWAYGARPRTAWLVEQGVTLRYRAYELHPDLPPEGRPVRPGGRLDGVFDHIAAEGERQGQPFVKPTRSPNSRRALELLELTQHHVPGAVVALDEALARAHWVEGRAIDDPAVLAAVASAAMGEEQPRTALLERWRDGEGGTLVDASKAAAHEVGVTATPAWRIGGLTITGLHPSEQFERWAGRLLRRDD